MPACLCGFELLCSGTEHRTAQVSRGGGWGSVIAFLQETESSAWHRQDTGNSSWAVCSDGLFCFWSKKVKSAVIFSLLVSTSFKALSSELIHKPAPTLLTFKEHILPKDSFLGFDGSTLQHLTSMFLFAQVKFPLRSVRYREFYNAMKALSTPFLLV